MLQRTMGLRLGWMLLVLVGCEGVLPPPPPPRMRTASATTPPAATSESIPEPTGAPAPRGPNSAPEQFKVKFETSKGDVVVDVRRHLAPLGVDRFHQLVKEGFYDGCKFFRVVPGFVVQFGMNGDPEITRKYQDAKIDDDERKMSNKRGTLTFATSGENSRTTQLFFNLGDNSQLDPRGFSPFGTVVEGMDEVVAKINDEYREEPNQNAIAQVGNTYLDERFPNLDFIVKATIIEADGKPVESGGDAKASE